MTFIPRPRILRTFGRRVSPPSPVARPIRPRATGLSHPELAARLVELHHLRIETGMPLEDKVLALIADWHGTHQLGAL